MRTVTVAVLMAVVLASCERRRGSAPATQRVVVHPTVASLVPAATDLLVGMGAGDHLVAVSNYDQKRGEVEGLPRVGDYQSVDWERVGGIRPDVMITFQAPDRLPAGMRERAEELGIRIVNIRTETLADLYREIGHLGEVVNEESKAREAEGLLRGKLEEVRKRAAGRPRVRTLIVRDERAAGAVGVGNFLNDVLEIAGGENVLKVAGWPTIDREQLLALKPDAVVELLADAPQQVEEAARGVWGGIDVPAVRAGRVGVINRWYAVQPGFHLPELAEEMRRVIQGEKFTTEDTEGHGEEKRGNKR